MFEKRSLFNPLFFDYHFNFVMKILFINSFQRSGSTLLGMILDRHQDIKYLGEVRNIHDALLHDEKTFSGSSLKDDQFWRKVLRGLEGDPLSLYTKVQNKTGTIEPVIHLSNLFDSRYVDRFLQLFSGRFRKEQLAYCNIRSYYRSASENTPETWLVDSSHRTSEARSHLSVMGRKISVLYLVRDGRGVLYSVLKRSEEQAETVIKRWKRFTLRARRFHRLIPSDQLVTIRYEDLCEDLPAQLSRLTDFMDIEAFGLGAQSSGKVPSFIGGSSTLRSRGDTNLSIKLDEQWRHKLGKKELEIFEKVAGGLNRSLGYQ